MDDTGKPNSFEIHNFVNIELPRSALQVQSGLLALLSTHNFTNRMVDHEGQALNDVLTSKDVLRTYVLALYVELGEFIQELDWKPWRTRTKPVDPLKINDEFADILAFIGVLLTILEANGITPAALAKAYELKELVNVDRFLAAEKDRLGSAGTP